MMTEIKSKIYSFNLRVVLKHILHSQDVFFSEFAFSFHVVHSKELVLSCNNIKSRGFN